MKAKPQFAFEEVSVIIGWNIEQKNCVLAVNS